ncbi:MAG: hypothetical protein A2X86_13680 [Bdellovibrionales bacterium GWA2_49_15]|nr:MAG: hypothetical protein A2X86_13680 [Bdellovibrionales bacterium GWA2_49_15]HAZ13577.1 hypothetical protein [Bdellovibrionales bacterium]
MNFQIIFLLCSLVVAPVVQADPSIGRVVKILGNAKKENPNMAVNENIKNGDDIYVGDQIITGDKAFVKILLSDETLFQLGPKTEFKFEKFNMRSQNDRDALYHLSTGKLRSLFTQKNKDNSLIIKTPTASMGIRGTEILSDVFMRNGQMNTDIALLSGKMEVSIPQIDKSVKMIELIPGQILETIGARGPNITAAPGALPQGVQSNIKQLPVQMMNQLKRPENQGGTVFLFDTYRKDLKNSGEIKFSEMTISKAPMAPVKIDGKPGEMGKPGLPPKPLIDAPKIVNPAPGMVNTEIKPPSEVVKLPPPPIAPPPIAPPPPPPPTAPPATTDSGGTTNTLK